LGGSGGGLTPSGEERGSGDGEGHGKGPFLKVVGLSLHEAN